MTSTRIFEKIVPFLVSLIFIIDTLAFIVGGLWLALDAVWGAIGWGILGGFFLALALSIVMTLLMFLLIPSIILYKKDLMLLYYISIIPWSTAFAIAMSFFYFYVLDFFSEYSSGAHPIALLLWSYSIATGALGLIGNNSRQSADGGFSYGLFVMFSKVSFISFIILYLLGFDSLFSIATSFVINFFGILFLIIIEVSEKHKLNLKVNGK